MHKGFKTETLTEADIIPSDKTTEWETMPSKLSRGEDLSQTTVQGTATSGDINDRPGNCSAVVSGCILIAETSDIDDFFNEMAELHLGE